MDHGGQALQREIRPMKRPGHWVRTAAARVCARRTLERMVDPIVADIQAEHEEAVRAGRWWRAVWIRVSGYTSFWKAVGFHTLQSGPRSLWDSLAADGWPLGRLIAYSLIAFVSVTLLLTAPPMIHLYARAQNVLKPTLLLLPQAIPLSIPIALSLGIVSSVYDIGVQARIRGVLVLATLATLVSFAALLTLPVANQAWRVAMAEELGSRGITKYSLPRGMNELSFSELARGSMEYDAGGFPETARRFRRTYHLRFALPAATFVLSLLALGICGTVRSRGVRVAALVIGLGVYYLALLLAESKPLTTILPPIVSVWVPNVVFTAMSVALLKLSSGRYQPFPAE
jgi:hypothetical protein